jgi:glycerate-2-kinase
LSQPEDKTYEGGRLLGDSGRHGINVVQNAVGLLSHGEVQLRRAAIDIINHALRGIDPYEPARATIERALHAPGLPSEARFFFVGAGKASFRIALAAEEVLGSRLANGVVICKHGEIGALTRIRVRHGAHPLPDMAGAAATAELVKIVGEARPGDVLLTGFTGGSSALLVQPCEQLSLSDVRSTTGLLLGCGANIVEINAVRKHLSAVGGGRLLTHLAAGVHLVAMTVSDVIGDPLDYITDPVVADTSTLADARNTLSRYGLWNRLPGAVRAFLSEGGGARETPKAVPFQQSSVQLLVPFGTASALAAQRASQLGFESRILTTSLEGESREAARFLTSIVREAAQTGSNSIALILSGETVVRLGESAGVGGPNQELAVAATQWLDRLPGCLIASIGTDGTDGPTDYAGGLVDGASAECARRVGARIDSALATHASTEFLQAIGDLIYTGPTGTNVSDLVIALVGTPR